jgi:hypothetical protein
MGKTSTKRYRNRNRNRRSKSTRDKIHQSTNKNELGILGSIIGLTALGSEISSESSLNNNNNLDVESSENIFMGGSVDTTKSLDVSDLILRFMEMLNTIKIFHWSTLSYPTHKATDDLHSKMSELVDSFIEQYIGGIGKGKIPVFRGNQNRGNIPFCECKSIEQFKKKLEEYKHFLTSFTERFEGVSELLNIRDEMIGVIDQTVYLLRLK